MHGLVLINPDGSQTLLCVGSLNEDGKLSDVQIVDIPWKEPDTMDKNPEQFVGLTEHAAIQLSQSLGMTFRIVNRDGDPRIVTHDYNTNRVNFTIESGNVVKATIK